MSVKKQRRFEREIEKVINRNFNFINKPGGSSNINHICLHKLYVNWRARHPNNPLLGKLKFIGSEVPVYTSVPNDNYIHKLDGEFVFEPNTSKKDRGMWQADSLELWKTNGERTYSRVIEVLPSHPYNIFVDNTNVGRRTINDFRDYLIQNEFIDDETRHNLTNQIKQTKFNSDESQFKKFHFWLADNVNPEEVDYDRFSDLVDQISELERKQFLWNSSTDDLVFVIFERDAQAYRSDLEKLAEKGTEIESIGLASISYGRFKKIMEYNRGGIYGVKDSSNPIRMPRMLRRDKGALSSLFRISKF